MHRKQYFAFNPVWVGIATAIVLLIGIFLGIVFFDPGRRTYLFPRGVMFSLIAGYSVDYACFGIFLNKLARRYPEKSTDILALRKLVFSLTDRKWQKNEKTAPSYNSIIDSLSQSSPDILKIDAEWQITLKWISCSATVITLTPLIHLLLADWISAVRPAVLAWLGSIGF